MLRLWYRVRTAANLAVFHAARNNAVRGVHPRLFSSTPLALAKSKEAKKSALKRRTAKARAQRKQAKSGGESSDKKSKVKESDDLVVEPGEEALASRHRGAGVWMSLQARLQSATKAKSPDDEALTVQGEGAPLLFEQEAVLPTEMTVESEERRAEEEGEGEEGQTTKTKTPKGAKKVKGTKEARKGKGRKKKGKGTTAEEETTASKDKKGAKAKTADLNVETIVPKQLALRPVEEDPHLDVPKLSYDLDRALFNPGVYHIQDPRSHVFNFDPYLTSIMPVDEFDFDALKEYITSSKDVKLRQLSAKHGMKYCGSTSSMTSILSHFHFLLSGWRQPNLKTLSRSLTPESYNFTSLTRGPAAAFARLQDGVYAIDADKQYDTENILSLLGKSMEKLLTLPKEEFEKYRRTRSHQLSEEEKNADEAFHYTTMGDFMMRSQLDAHDPRLPGTGMFDLKTRAVVSIRMDVRGYEKGVGYEIRERFGQWESFEREYYDMIRAAFLKYSLQVRMGRMDGIFVAFHNTRRIFGFQYISLAEMDDALHGTSDTRLGDQEFKASIAMLNDLLNRATERFPGRSLRLHVETRPTKVPLTYFFVEPVTDEQIQDIQEAGKSSIEQIERDIRSISDESKNAEAEEPREEEAEAETESADSIKVRDIVNDGAWETMMAKVEETVENESLGIGSVKEAIQDALEHSGLLTDKTELETEQCLDAMVASLTAHSARIRQLRDGASDVEESLELAHDGDEANSPETAQTSADEEEDEEEDDDDDDEEDEEDDEDEDEEGPEQDTSLRDLILKATEGINKTQNLETFQRIFTDLASKKQPAVTPEEEDADDLSEGEEDKQGEDADSVGAGEAGGPRQGELMGLYVTIRNKVNGNYVNRPDGDDKTLDWAIEYAVTELPLKRAQTIYAKIKKRRRTALSRDSRAAEWHQMFRGHLPIITKKGERFRKERTLEEANRPLYVAWDREPRAKQGAVE